MDFALKMINKKIKILFLMNLSTKDKTLGGVEKHILDSVTFLNPNFFEYSIASDNDLFIKIIQKRYKKNTKTYLLKNYDNDFQSIFFLFELFKILKKERPDILHTHKLKSSILGRIAGKLSGIPTISTLHAPIIDWPIPLYKKIINSVLNHATANYFGTMSIAVSVHEKQISMHKEFIKEKKIKVIYNGLFDYPQNVIPKQPTPFVKIISVGRLSFEKGHDLVIQAIPDIVHRIPNVRFIFIGDGPERGPLRKKTEMLKVDRYVDFRGNLSHDDVIKSLLGGSIFLFPSLFEGLPYAIIEAMFCSLPVIASNVGGFQSSSFNKGGGAYSPLKTFLP